MGAGAQVAGSRRGRHGRASAGRAGQAAAGARQGAAGRGRAQQREAGELGARPVRAGWASWVLVHSTWFSTWFFDSKFFPSHQLNTVHCKINFGKKNILNLIKIK